MRGRLAISVPTFLICIQVSTSASVPPAIYRPGSLQQQKRALSLLQKILRRALFGSPVDFYMYEATLQVGFPDSLKEVGEGAFYSVDLNELVLPEGTEKIDNKAFYLADIRSEELLLPDSITEMHSCISAGKMLTEKR